MIILSKSCRMTASLNGNIFRVTGRLWGESLHKGQWRGALMFSLICAWTNGWTSKWGAGDFRRHRAHDDLTVMDMSSTHYWEDLNLVITVIADAATTNGTCPSVHGHSDDCEARRSSAMACLPINHFEYFYLRHNQNVRWDFETSQIAKTLGSMSIRYRSDAKVSGRYLIDVDPRIFGCYLGCCGTFDG